MLQTPALIMRWYFRISRRWLHPEWSLACASVITHTHTHTHKHNPTNPHTHTNTQHTPTTIKPPTQTHTIPTLTPTHTIYIQTVPRVSSWILMIIGFAKYTQHTTPILPHTQHICTHICTHTRCVRLTPATHLWSARPVLRTIHRSWDAKPFRRISPRICSEIHVTQDTDLIYQYNTTPTYESLNLKQRDSQLNRLTVHIKSKFTEWRHVLWWLYM
jgi:hypothetical protein